MTKKEIPFVGSIPINPDIVKRNFFFPFSGVRYEGRYADFSQENKENIKRQFPYSLITQFFAGGGTTALSTSLKSKTFITDFTVTISCTASAGDSTCYFQLGILVGSEQIKIPIVVGVYTVPIRFSVPVEIKNLTLYTGCYGVTTCQANVVINGFREE